METYVTRLLILVSLAPIFRWGIFNNIFVNKPYPPQYFAYFPHIFSKIIQNIFAFQITCVFLPIRLKQP